MNFNQFNRSVSLNQKLAKYTWFNVGGNAEILFIPDDIKELFDFLKSNRVIFSRSRKCTADLEIKTCLNPCNPIFF